MAKHRTLEERKKELDRKQALLNARIERKKVDDKIRDLRKKK
jgi:hypothetical protein